MVQGKAIRKWEGRRAGPGCGVLLSWGAAYEQANKAGRDCLHSKADLLEAELRVEGRGREEGES